MAFDFSLADALTQPRHQLLQSVVLLRPPSTVCISRWRKAFLGAMALPRTWDQRGEYFIPLRLQLLTRMIEREMSREMHAAFDLSVAEWRVLAMTCTYGPVSAAQVSAAFEADPGQVSRAVASLIKTGLIQRERTSSGRNKKSITPTARGSEVFEALHCRRQAYFNMILRDLTPEDLQAFDNTLSLIAQRVDEQRTMPGEA